MQDVTVFNQAIAAHGKWKHYLLEAIETGTSNWTQERVRSDSECEFGKWLASLPSEERSTEHYPKVLDLHKEFHQVVSDILELAISGRTEEAREAVALRSRFGMLSSHLTLAMSAWKSAYKNM